MCSAASTQYARTVESDPNASVEARLRDLSETIWKTAALDGEERAVACGECAPLTPGLIIDLANMTGTMHGGRPASRKETGHD